jgi:hypothetical protein
MMRLKLRTTLKLKMNKVQYLIILLCGFTLQASAQKNFKYGAGIGT